jgi:cytochrome c oxidase assembly factor CtaG
MTRALPTKKCKGIAAGAGAVGVIESGWLVASAALLSPLCALSVALFSARIAQHMVLVLVAAPLIAVGLPRTHVSTKSWPLWGTSAIFFLALWFWHMPIPYDATFTSVSVYWTMHITLFGSGILLWRELLYHSPRQTAQVLAAGTLTFRADGTARRRADLRRATAVPMAPPYHELPGD